LTYSADSDCGKMTDPSFHQRRRPTSTKPQLSDSNKNLVFGLRMGLMQRLTGQLTVGHNGTVALTWGSDLWDGSQPARR
jgi:hypothetical protein